MMKIAKLSAISLAILFLQIGGSQTGSNCSAAKSQSSWRMNLRDGSMFFPYRWCLAFKVLSASPHTTYECKTDNAALDVKVKVEYILRDGWDNRDSLAYARLKNAVVQAGDTVTLCLPREPQLDLEKYINALNGKPQVWAFTSAWLGENKRFHFYTLNHFEPFRNQEFSRKDLEELTAELRRTIMDPQKAKLAIEKYLRARWPENRIREFCHKDNRLIRWVANPNPDNFRAVDTPEFDCLNGLLYPRSALGKVMWEGYTVNETPTGYGLVVKRGKSVWQLERIDFELGSSFSDDEALKMRIYDTLSYAHALDATLHRLPDPPVTKERASGEKPGLIEKSNYYSPLQPPTDWRTGTIQKANKSGKALAISWETSSGRLRAVLDDNKEIKSVTVNGKPDNGWMQALVAANKERSKMYDQ